MRHSRVSIKSSITTAQQGGTPVGKVIVAEAVNGKAAIQWNSPSIHGNQRSDLSTCPLPETSGSDRSYHASAEADE
jgi:hypothetical protein